MVGSGVLRTGLEAGARVVATSHAWLDAGPTQRALQTLVAPSTHKLRALRLSSSSCGALRQSINWADAVSSQQAATGRDLSG